MTGSLSSGKTLSWPSDFSPVMLLKHISCWSDWRWPFSSCQRSGVVVGMGSSFCGWEHSSSSSFFLLFYFIFLPAFGLVSCFCHLKNSRPVRI